MLLQSTNLYKKIQKRYSRRINLNLKRINLVLKKLNNPELKITNPINILGSDGKMSVLTSLKYFLESNNKFTNTFTSPHLYNFQHRFWLKNNYISLKKINKKIKLIEKTKLKLTLFELFTCVFILSAKEKKVNYNLIESGLLFKKDSTNLWRNPRAQIITNINFQHQEWVKPKTLKEICKQKLESLSQNTNIYIGKQNPKTLKIIKKILKNNKSNIIYPDKWKIIQDNKKYYYKENKIKIPLISNKIHSNGLIDNLGLAIKVALDFGVKKDIIVKTIPKIEFEGRLQYLRKGKIFNLLKKNEKLLLDGCHSEVSAKNLNNYLKTVKGPIYGIWGMKKNKMPERFIKIFKKRFKKLITVSTPNDPSSINKNILKKIGIKNKLKTFSSNNIIHTLKLLSDGENKTIVIFGSLYLVGYVLSKN